MCTRDGVRTEKKTNKTTEQVANVNSSEWVLFVRATTNYKHAPVRAISDNYPYFRIFSYPIPKKVHSK